MMGQLQKSQFLKALRVAEMMIENAHKTQWSRVSKSKTRKIHLIS